MHEKPSTVIGVIVVVLSLVMTSANVIAGEGTGHITEFKAHSTPGSGNYAFLVETMPNRAACATYGNGRFATNN
jgi:hypothetical protein